jgi:hypothetical protein
MYSDNPKMCCQRLRHPLQQHPILLLDSRGESGVSQRQSCPPSIRVMGGGVSHRWRVGNHSITAAIVSAKSLRHAKWGITSVEGGVSQRQSCPSIIRVMGGGVSHRASPLQHGTRGLDISCKGKLSRNVGKVGFSHVT